TDVNTNTAQQTKFYTGTQVFAVGTEGTGDVVVMSIGSTEIVKNDVVSDMGVAPIIENGRTFVPYRAGLEALGATVAYDEAAQAVTAEMNGVTVVMTIGSNVYTVNGVENTMDVAPFIVDGRTMVPARFAAQAFGITVIPTQNPDGTTADVLYIM
ncbi:MAG: copper amine oxidase N-terminal domain-containing protein, partial [Peptococcaceae bacterium]|nr:copper amine oxidase N-terminal domain-containing protein [Peptococcaceae bacterium]